MTTTTTQTALERRVAARNKLNRLAAQYRLELAAVLAPYLGKKIRKVSGYGGWVKALEKPIEELRASYMAENCRVCFEFSGTRFWAEFSLSYQGDPGHCLYLKQTLFLGRCVTEDGFGRGKADGILTELEHPEESLPRTDWTVDEVQNLMNQQKHYKELLREVESGLSAFNR